MGSRGAHLWTGPIGIPEETRSQVSPIRSEQEAAAEFLSTGFLVTVRPPLSPKCLDTSCTSGERLVIPVYSIFSSHLWLDPDEGLVPLHQPLGVMQ